MAERFINFLQTELETLKEEGLYKAERIISSQQKADVTVNNKEVINLCANNYLGLANDAQLILEGQEALAEYGYGMASVRFICGTQTPHKSWNRKSVNFWVKKIPYFILPVLMPILVSLKLYWVRKTPLSVML